MEKFIRSKEVISGQIQDEIVMMDIGKSEYFTLNPVASRIWELLENEMNKEGICQVLITEYEVDDEQCRKEVEEHLNILIKLGLVVKTT